MAGKLGADAGDLLSEPDHGAACQGCADAFRALLAERDRLIVVVSDQARTLERVTSELRWHGLDDAALTVREAYEMYERARRGDDCWPQYRALLAPLLLRFGDLPCLQLTPEKWAEHRQTRKTERCGRWADRQAKAHYPTSAVLDRELAIAKMLFRWMVRADRLPRNPLEFAKGANAPGDRETYLRASDVQRLIDGADVLGGETPALKRRVLLFQAFVAILFGCALRFNEARKLRRDRIGDDGVLELSAKQTKAKKKRTVALTAAAIEAIAALPVLAHDPRIFTHNAERGRTAGKLAVVSAASLRNWFHVVAKKTGVSTLAVDGERVVPHVLRHSAAAHVDAMGAHPRDTQEFLDHESLATTEKYLHRRPALRAQRIRELMERRTATP